MRTIAELVRDLQDTGEFDRVRLDPLAQFGPEGNPYLGSTLLPEVVRDSNAYTETQIRYQSAIALDGSSYSPAQLSPGGHLIGEFDVKFGLTNIADQMNAQFYEGLRKLLMQSGSSTNADIEAAAQLIQWMDKSLTIPMLKKNELQRWQAIIDASVPRKGSNGYVETVSYPNPAGHRITVGGGSVGSPTGWFSRQTDPTAALYWDPWNDLFAVKREAARKGYRINRIISAYEPGHLLAQHPVTTTRLSGITINVTGSLDRAIRVNSFDSLNAELQANELPTWEIYDRTYDYPITNGDGEREFTFSRYLERADYWPVIMVCTTGRDQVIDLGDRSTVSNVIQLQETLGYYGVGRVVGQGSTGRHLYTEVSEKHPVGMYAEMLQMGLPVITEPEAIFVLKIMKPTV